MKFKAIFISVLFIILSFSFVSAEVPKMINYQGKLTTPKGKLIDGVVSIVFTIYDSSTGGTALWTETQGSVTVEKGIFSVLLGSVNEIPDSVFDGSVRYLGVKVGDDSEMTPRKVIVSVGYAFRSEIADTALYAIEAVSAESDSDWIFSGNDMYSAVSGNVGIGTMEPTEKLDVNGNIRIRIGNRLKLFNTDDTDYGTIHGVQSGGVAGISFNTDTFGNALYIKNDGNVGIGTTSPDEKLTVSGNVHITGNLMVDGTTPTSTMDYGYEDNIPQCGTRYVSFNVTFSSPPVVIVGYKGDIGCDEHGNLSAYDVSTTGFTIRNARPQHSRNAYWIAIGPGQ